MVPLGDTTITFVAIPPGIIGARTLTNTSTLELLGKFAIVPANSLPVKVKLETQLQMLNQLKGKYPIEKVYIIDSLDRY